MVTALLNIHSSTNTCNHVCRSLQPPLLFSADMTRQHLQCTLTFMISKILPFRASCHVMTSSRLHSYFRTIPSHGFLRQLTCHDSIYSAFSLSHHSKSCLSAPAVMSWHHLDYILTKRPFQFILCQLTCHDIIWITFSLKDHSNSFCPSWHVMTDSEVHFHFHFQVWQELEIENNQ